MKPDIILGLALVLSGGVLSLGGTMPVSQEYEACWLSNGARGEYVNLVLTRRPLTELPSLSLPINQPVLDCDAVIVTTYARDSIWKNADGKSFKPLTGVERVGTNFVVIKGEQFACTHANLEGVLQLLRNPMGKIPIHRIYGVSAQEEPIRTLASRLERQLNNEKKAEKP